MNGLTPRNPEEAHVPGGAQARPAAGNWEPIVYEELRGLANNILRHHRSRSDPGDEVLEANSLVHETYIRLANRGDEPLESREHFFGLATKAMRNILVDRARRRRTVKRGGGCSHVPLEQQEIRSIAPDPRLLALDEALNALAELDARKAHIVELRFFGGLTVDETAEILGISPATVKREWPAARKWLYREIHRD